MKKQMHRLLSFVLSLILVVGLIPGTMIAHAAETTVVEISEIPGLTVGDTLSQQTLKDAVPSVTSYYNYYPVYYIWNSDSYAINTVTKVKEENIDKVHYAYYVWTLSGTEVPNASDYVVKYNGTELTHKYGSHQSSENWYYLYKGTDGNILCMVHIYLGKPAAAPGSHEHTYSENWSYDTRFHWRAATCEHTTEKADYEKHTLVDGKCKCGFEHTHDWDTAWSYNEGQHWHNCKAENCPAYFVHDRDGWGFHDADAYGNCSDCGMPMFTPSYSVLAVGGNADKTGYAPGETVTITAYGAADGYKFVGWTTKDGVEFADATNATTTFVMPAKDVRVDANYDKLSVFHITVVGGTANKEGVGENKYKAEKGDTITITAYDAPDGKKFVGWQVTVNDMFVDVDLADATAKETTFEMPEGNVRVDAVFEDLPATYHVTVEGGTADKYEAEAGETITITAQATPDGMKFVGWEVVNGDGFTSVVLDNTSAATTSFTMPAGNVKVNAVFEEIPVYHVTVVGGTADKEAAGENEYKAEPGDTIKITAYAPGSNQKFAGWEVTVNEMFVDVELADASAAETTFVMPNGNVRVDAVFEDVIPDKYSVQVVGGNADREDAKYAPGEIVTITAYPPASDMQFAKWTTEDGVTFADATKATTTFVMPAKDVRVDATYEDEIPDKYSVQVVGGNADREDAKYAPGEIVTITAYPPASDMQFAKWTTEDGVTFANAANATTTFVMPAKDVRVDATYEDKIPSGKDEGSSCKDETPSGTSEAPAAEANAAPHTGDTSTLSVWAALLFVSGLVLAVTVLGKKRNSAK